MFVFEFISLSMSENMLCCDFKKKIMSITSAHLGDAEESYTETIRYSSHYSLANDGWAQQARSGGVSGVLPHS